MGTFMRGRILIEEEQEREVLGKGIEILQRITGKRPRGYRAPSWEMRERTPRLLKENDFKYDSSLMEMMNRITFRRERMRGSWRSPSTGRR